MVRAGLELSSGEVKNELNVLVKGLIGAIKTMLWIMVLLLGIIFAMGLFCMSNDYLLDASESFRA